MATTLLLRSAFQFHDTSPKNQGGVTTNFSVGFGPVDIGDVNANQLCSDLCDKWAFMPGIGATTPFSVSAYKRGGAKLGLPVGKATRNPTGTPKVLSIVPEVAVCLSYYAGTNAPRRRGRMYLPAWLGGAASPDLGPPMGGAQSNACVPLGGYLASLGGLNVDWGVWSQSAPTFRKATDYFI